MTSNKKYLLLIATLERRYIPKLRKVISLAYSSFSSDVQAHGLHQAKQNLLLTPINPDIAKILQEIYKIAGVKGARMTYSELRASLKQEQKSAGFGRNERWIRDVLNYLKLNGLEFASYISDTIKEDILKILEKAAEEGWSIDKIAFELTHSSIPLARARVIARTEIVRAANVGHSIGARDFPFEVNKSWSAAKDHRTRHSHRMVDGHVTDEDGTFNVQVYKGDKPTGKTDKMQFPGDPNAHPSNTINCRCRVLYEAKRDAQGNLIRRSESAPVIPIRAFTGQQLPSRIAAELKSQLLSSVSFTIGE